MVYQIYPRSLSRTPTATASATCPGSSRGSITSPSSASTRSGSRRSTRHRSPTGATTSPTSRPSTRASERSPTCGRSPTPPTPEASRSCSTSSRATRRSSTPGFASTPTATSAADSRPNNWRAAFGGPAWTRDAATGRWYLHSFFPEQPDLDWRNPEVGEAMGDVVRFWLDQGADGFRVDAIDRVAKHPDLLDDPPRAEPFPFPEPPDVAALDRRHSSHWPPGLAGPLARAARGRRRRLPRRRGLPPDRRARPVPRPSRHRLRLRADVRAVAGRRGRRRDRARRRPQARRRGCSPTTTSAASGAGRRGRDARRGDAPSHAPRRRVRLPGRRDRAARRAGR